MKKLIGYKIGYRIQIIDGFYEVVNGRCVTHFGKCRKNSTIQEIVNKTIDLDQEEIEDVTYRGTRLRQDVARAVPERNRRNETTNVTGLRKGE